MTRWIAAIVVGLAIVTVAAMAAAAGALGGIKMSTIGWLALAGGALLSLAVGIGLMLLISYSSRAGFDERAGTPRAGNEETLRDREETPRGPG